MSSGERACPACQRGVPAGARFCGHCGFKQAPLAAADGEAILLTRVKRQGREPSSATPVGSGSDPLILQTRKLAPASEALAPLPEASGRTGRGVPPTAPRTAPSLPALPKTIPAEHFVHPKLRARPRAQRFPMKVEVNYGSAHNFYTGFVENISSGGLFIATHDIRPLGEVIEVTFVVPGLADPCDALCRVCWHREFDPDNSDMVPGMGCTFGPLEPEVRAAIDAFIAHRDPIFFEP